MYFLINPNTLSLLLSKHPKYPNNILMQLEYSKEVLGITKMLLISRGYKVY